MVVELPGGSNDAIARRRRDFTISTQGAAGRRDGGAGALSYILKGSESAHGSGIFNNITKFAGPGCLKSANVFIWVVIRNQCSPKPQQKVFHNAHSQSIQAQLQPSHLACRERDTLRKKIEKRSFFLADPKNRMFAFALRTFSPK